MQTGRLRDLAEIYRLENKRNEFGVVQQVYARYQVFWCELKQLSMNYTDLQYDVKQFHPVTYEIKCRCYLNINPKDQICIRGQKYSIVSIFDDRRIDTKTITVNLIE